MPVVVNDQQSTEVAMTTETDDLATMTMSVLQFLNP
jgi:hypothetical protein